MVLKTDERRKGKKNVWLGFWFQKFWLTFGLGAENQVLKLGHHDECRLIIPRGKHVSISFLSNQSLDKRVW